MPVIRSQSRFVTLLFFAFFAPIFARATENLQIMGYYFPREGYLVRDIDRSGAAGLLTQLNYAFGTVRSNRCFVTDPERELQQPYAAGDSVSGQADSAGGNTLRGAFHQLQLLKARFPKLKLVLSVGGWTGSGGFSSAAEPANRAAFVRSCVDTFLKGNFAPGIREPGIFDGIDIDWEYPVGDGLQPGRPEDKENFTALMKELRRQMDALRPGLILSAALPATQDDYAYFDLKRIGEVIDQVQLMAYDMHSDTEPLTNFHSALFHDPADPSPAAEQSHYADFAVRAFLAAGVPSRKLILGVPFYGKGYTPVEDTNHGLFEPSYGPAKGDGSYRMLKALPASADRQFYSVAGSCSIWYENNFWSYDCPEAMRMKRKYALQKSLGGIMFWELSQDSPDSDLLRAIAGQ